MAGNMEDGSAAGKGSREASDPVEGSRRRVGSLKRKNNSSAGGPSKRLAKDKSPLPPLHNGPLRTTRQSPIKLAAAAAAAAAQQQQQKKVLGSNPIPPSPPQKPDHLAEPNAKPEVVGEDPKLGGVDQSPIVLSMELSEEALRDENAHVVPTPAGWFSWRKIHPLEKRGLPSFFNGKSKTRNPEMYLQIRNSIMKQYHNSPHKQIGLTDLSDTVTEDMGAVREIMDFLDHWGLINFRPFPNCQQDDTMVHETSNSSAGKEALETDEARIAASLLEKLYCFEKDNHHSGTNSSGPISSRALPTPVLAEAVVPEVLNIPQGPQVEYHCNACSADCSTKRYHCQKQADFDLCSECYNAGKFGTGTVSTDFILMEPMTERAGVNGGSWTDQETLLLLEALELYGDNWNEISEHVATKSTAQCILHFIRLPIEDPFLEDKETPENTIIQSSLETVLASKDSASAASQSTSESPVAKSPSSEELPGVSKNDDSKSKQVDEGEPAPKKTENDAIKALGAAFQAVGALSGSEESMSFAEAGNPVMALVAFLAAMVGPEAAAGSAQSALKAISEEAPATQLAARHCFLLEDPPSDSKDPPSDSKDNTNERTDAQNLENETLPLEHSKGSEKDTSKIVSVSAIPEAPQRTDMVEATASGQEPQVGDVGSNLAASEEDTGKVDPENPCSANEKKCSEDSAGAEDSCSLDKLKDENDKKCLQDSTEMDDSPDNMKDANEKKCLQDSIEPDNSPEKMKDANEKKCPEDSVEVEDSLSDKLKPENEKKCPEDSVEIEDSLSDKLKHENEKKCPEESVEIEDSNSLDKLKCAAASVLSGTAVRAKLLANQEEEQIQKLVSEVIDNQLKKLEIKLRYFRELESALAKEREQIDKARQRLRVERAQIIGAVRPSIPGPLPRSSSLSSTVNTPAVALGQFPIGGASNPVPSLNTGTTKPPAFTYPKSHIRKVTPSADLNSMPASSSAPVSSIARSPSQTVAPLSAQQSMGANIGSGLK